MLSSFFFLAAAEDGADAGKAIALALGIGLGSVSYTHLTLPTTPYV